VALQEGIAAPKFSGKTNGDSTISIEELNGKWIVLYFYPKDDTPGCTKEACGFNDNIDEITKLGAVVLGVSPDSPSKHDKFIAKYNLSFKLIADEDNSIATAYEAWGEKSMYGKKYMGILRSTYLIDPNGKIAKAFPKVTPDKHAQEVITALKELA
jgi:peroxiredoxin Q/BCP